MRTIKRSPLFLIEVIAVATLATLTQSCLDEGSLAI